MKRILHNQNERFDDQKAERGDALTDQRFLDYVFRRILHVASGAIADGESGYFDDGSGLIEYVSGQRETGMTFRLPPGVGFKKHASGQPTADDPGFVPVVVLANDDFVLAASDPTNDRIDRVFLRPLRSAGNSQTVDIIDPGTGNITPTSQNVDNSYAYELLVVTGTPAASPTPPAPTGSFTASDAIADITVRAGSGSFTPSDLDTSLRTPLRIADGLIPGEAADILTTRGDIIVRDASTAVRLALGAAGEVFASDGTDGAWTDPATLGAAYPPGHLNGLTMTRPAVDRITIATGSCRDAANTVNMDRAATITKQIDSDWVAGDGNGGFPETEIPAAVQPNQWYGVFLIENGSGTVDAGFDTSPVAANLLTETGYTKYRRLGWIRTNGSSEIIDFIQDGDLFDWVAPGVNGLEGDANLGSQSGSAWIGGVTVTLDYAPPSVQARMAVAWDSLSGGFYLYPTDVNHEAPDIDASPTAPIGHGTGANPDANLVFVRTDASRQIRANSPETTAFDVNVSVHGWRDDRDRA